MSNKPTKEEVEEILQVWASVDEDENNRSANLLNIAISITQELLEDVVEHSDGRFRSVIDLKDSIATQVRKLVDENVREILIGGSLSNNRRPRAGMFDYSHADSHADMPHTDSEHELERESERRILSDTMGNLRRRDMEAVTNVRRTPPTVLATGNEARQRMEALQEAYNATESRGRAATSDMHGYNVHGMVNKKEPLFKKLMQSLRRKKR